MMFIKLKRLWERRKRSIIYGFILLLFTAGIAWATTGIGSNPYGSDYYNQGYVPIRFTFPDGTTEYRNGPCWGQNPQDGKIALYEADVSSKLQSFLEANKVILDKGQYDLYRVYMHMDSGYWDIDTTGCAKGSGQRIQYGSGQDAARSMPQDTIKNYLEYTNTWLFNAPSDSPPPGNWAAPPGWKVVMKFSTPDMQVKSVSSGAPAVGAVTGTTYFASANFYLNYNMGGNATVRLYQFKKDGTARLLTEMTRYFGDYQEINVGGVPWVMDANTSSIVASVAFKYDNGSKIWIRDSYYNNAITLNGDKADRDWSNNLATSATATITPPPATGGNDTPSNLAVTKLELLDSSGRPISGTVEINKPYRVRATFSSKFDFGGTAKIRFYVKREAGWMELRAENSVYFSPNGTYEKTWDWTGTSEQVTVIATIAYRWWDQQNKYAEEPFEGKTETTYTDNLMQTGVAGTDIPNGPPPPGSWEYPLYYPRAYEELTPVYENYLESVYGWQLIPFTREAPNGRKRVYLIE
jgi:hypothetical protein